MRPCLPFLLLATALARPSLAGEADAPAAAISAPYEAEGPAPAPSLEHGKAFSGDATPIDPGGVEVEVAWAPSWWATPGAVDRAGQAQSFVLAVGTGLLPGLDLRAALGWSFLRESGGGAPEARGAGVGDAMFAVRWRFLHLEAPALDVAVVANVVVPTGTRESSTSLGTGQGAWAMGGAIVASVDRGPWTGNAEVGWSSRIGAKDDDDLGLLVANLAVGLQLAPWLQPEVELNYQHEVERGTERAERILWATAGLVAPVAPVRVVVGARLPVWQANASAGPTLTASVKLAF
jgi:hypothetical protein